jgi:hypothetical protein
MTIQYKDKAQTTQTTAYAEDTIESARAKAARMGCFVVFPEPTQLFVDIDTPAGLRTFVQNLPRLRGASYTVRPSQSGLPGHFHVTVAMSRPVSPIERIALQAMLGSDLTREILSWLRIQRGIEEPTIFFEREK